jgi:hypothetical protein
MEEAPLSVSKELHLMSASRKPRGDQPDHERAEEYVRVPAVVDANGDKVVTLYDEQGRPHTRLVAQVVLETFVGPRPPGHAVRFKDGDRLNCVVSNLEWAPPATPGPDESARAKAVATRQRADEIRKALEGRLHSDSAELVAEDRLR